VNGFEGESAGDVVGFVVGRGLEIGRPALGGFEEFGKGFADVAVAGAVVVEVVVEFVGDGGELLEEIVGVLPSAGFARVGEEILDRFVAGVEEFDEEENAVGGIVGGFAELLDFAVGESGFRFLGVQGESEREQEESEGKSTKHRSLMFGF
jgi:hypothetical protein